MPRTSGYFEYEGKSYSLRQWAVVKGVPYARLYQRLKSGWTFDRAITEERPPQTLTYEGRTLTLAEWGKRTGLTEQVIRVRVNLGWTPARALTTPPRVRAPRGESERITYNGETRPITDWAAGLGLTVAALRARFRRGWLPQQALTSPKLMHKGQRLRNSLSASGPPKPTTG